MHAPSSFSTVSTLSIEGEVEKARQLLHPLIFSIVTVISLRDWEDLKEKRKGKDEEAGEAISAKDRNEG